MMQLCLSIVLSLVEHLCSIHEQSSLKLMREVEPYGGVLCDTAVEEFLLQCICTCRLQLPLMVFYCIDCHIAYHQS